MDFLAPQNLWTPPPFRLKSRLTIFFSIRVFFRRHWRFTGQQGKGEDHLLFHSTNPNRSRILRHLFATLHVRWLPDCYMWDDYRDLPLHRITIWVTDWWCNICLLTWWIDSRFLLQRFDMGNRWIWTRIDYHPCITSKPTNQVCCSSLITDISQNNHILPRPFQSAFKYHNMDR